MSWEKLLEICKTKNISSQPLYFLTFTGQIIILVQVLKQKIVCWPITYTHVVAPSVDDVYIQTCICESCYILVFSIIDKPYLGAPPWLLSHNLNVHDYRKVSKGIMKREDHKWWDLLQIYTWTALWDSIGLTVTSCLLNLIFHNKIRKSVWWMTSINNIWI